MGFNTYVMAVVIAFMMNGSIFSQSLDSLVRPVGIIITGEYLRPQQFGPHVFNNSFDSWQGIRLGLGLSIYGKAELILSTELMNTTLTDRNYVFFATVPFNSSRVQLRAQILARGRWTYLYPEISIGNMNVNLQGDISGQVIELGNNFSFAIDDNFKLIAGLKYQRANFDVMTKPEFESLFKVSQAILPSISIQYTSTMRKDLQDKHF